MLFTRRFIKDLLLLGAFSLLFYVLTHNPITHPRPEPTLGTYSIQLMQYPLLLGIAGHNYLVLKDENGEIVRELHGLATDPKTNSWKYMGIKTTDVLRVWEFSSTDEYVPDNSYSGIVLHKGTKEEIVYLWSKALSCKEKINSSQISYPPFGINLGGDTENSNSVAYTLTLCMGLKTDHIGLFTPGSRRDLLEGK